MVRVRFGGNRHVENGVWKLFLGHFFDGPVFLYDIIKLQLRNWGTAAPS